jgi:hypothetical protein
MHIVQYLNRDLLRKIFFEFLDWNEAYEALEVTDKTFYHFWLDIKMIWLTYTAIMS